jgi:hypothetical protein
MLEGVYTVKNDVIQVALLGVVPMNLILIFFQVHGGLLFCQNILVIVDDFSFKHVIIMARGYYNEIRRL